LRKQLFKEPQLAGADSMRILQEFENGIKQAKALK
jgi:hypothetical protein